MICLAATAGLLAAPIPALAVSGQQEGQPVAHPHDSSPHQTPHKGLSKCSDGHYREACMTPNGSITGPKPMAAHPPHCSAGVHKPGCVGVKGPRISRR
jgi:hypothetical protein